MNGSETPDCGGTDDEVEGSTRGQVTLDIRTESTPCGDVQVIRPTGLVERQDIGHIQRTVLSSPLPVIIDLDDCILVGTSPFTSFEPAHAPGEVCVVSRRLTSRRLLARRGVRSRVAVFERLQDALQAKVSACAGDGRGWSAT